MKNYLIVVVSLVLALAAGCKNDVKQSEAPAPAPQVQPQAGISGKVAETMDASGYTYVLVDTGAEQVWVAGPMTALKVGDEVFVPEGTVMTNFESKTLGKTFEQILFASSIMVGGADQPVASASLPAEHPQTAATPAAIDFSGIAKPQGGKKVGEIFAERQKLNGSKVVVRGKVVKYMSGIMGKNWLHVKDGSGTPGSDDLVVTTVAESKVGDTVLVSGMLVTDKDFGSGYRYDVIVEDAEVKVE